MITSEDYYRQASLSYRKLYAQLVPDEPARRQLTDWQQSSGFANHLWVKPDKLHLTIIHFGKLYEAYQEVAVTNGLRQLEFEKRLEILRGQYQARLAGQTFELSPLAIMEPGLAPRTRSLDLSLTPQLTLFHRQCLDDLVNFFRDCGIDDVTTFMDDSRNFRLAQTIRPHVALLHSYRGPLPVNIQSIEIPTSDRLRFVPAPVTYNH